MTALDPSHKPGFRVRGIHVLFGVVGFFALVIGVDATFSVLAVRTFPGQVSVTPYEDGLLYNRHIAQLHAQEKLGWRATSLAAQGEVRVAYRDAAGEPVRGLAVSGRLERPATEAGRIMLRFAETAPGEYVAPTGRLTGAWDLTAEAEGREGVRFVAERRLTWP